MPRTEKKSTIINNSHLIENSYVNESSISQSKIPNQQGYVLQGSYHNSHINGHILRPTRKYDAGDMLRNKLLKKNRIMSSNQSKPSWW